MKMDEKTAIITNDAEMLIDKLQLQATGANVHKFMQRADKIRALRIFIKNNYGREGMDGKIKWYTTLLKVHNDEAKRELAEGGKP